MSEQTEYIETKEVAKLLGEDRPLSRQAIAAIAKREEWHKLDNHRPYQYLMSDVKDYIVSKAHTQQAKQERKVSKRGLLRHKDGFNRFCPYCNPQMFINNVS